MVLDLGSPAPSSSRLPVGGGWAATLSRVFRPGNERAGEGRRRLEVDTSRVVVAAPRGRCSLREPTIPTQMREHRPNAPLSQPRPATPVGLPHGRKVSTPTACSLSLWLVLANLALQSPFSGSRGPLLSTLLRTKSRVQQASSARACPRPPPPDFATSLDLPRVPGKQGSQ
ncbi:hypothetical protein GQ53DRAFT_335603 [Thozetella sp. PMI_491]|nr:hypothetical protein GQ53DRAFT_335603 [Thozetella sp. PMI_491]